MGKSFSTLIATALQHLSACRRCHSLTESVYLASLSFFRLIRSFHNISPAFFFSFFLFLRYFARSPTITFLIISKIPCAVKQFCEVFVFFVLFLRRRARSQRHYEILIFFIFYVFQRKRRNRIIERKHYFFFLQRFKRV